MGKVDRRIAELASRQFGLVTGEQLADAGLAVRTIHQRVASGRLIRRSRHVFALPGVPRTWTQDVLAAQLALGDAGAIGHRAAAVLWKIEPVTADGVDVLVAAGRRLLLPDVRVHRTRTLIAADVVHRRPFRLTSPVRTVIDLAGVLEEPVLEDALDDVLRRRIAHVDAIRERAEALGRGVPGIGILKRLLSLRCGTPRSGSSLENRFRRLLDAAGLPKPSAQHEIRDASGRLIARVDFAYPDARLAIEVDGFAFHSGRRAWHADLARQNRLVAAGWLPVRVTSDDVAVNAPVLELIRQAIGS